jgi:hypothetical protein
MGSAKVFCLPKGFRVEKKVEKHCSRLCIETKISADLKYAFLAAKREREGDRETERDRQRETETDRERERLHYLLFIHVDVVGRKYFFFEVK